MFAELEPRKAPVYQLEKREESFKITENTDKKLTRGHWYPISGLFAASETYLAAVGL